MITFFGCGFFQDDLPAPITKEIEGIYLYKYSSGEIEVLNIRLDSTYKQEIFLNENSYLSRSNPIYKNESTWNVSGKKINFNSWLMLSDFGLNFDTIKHKRKLLSYSGATWRTPNHKRQEYEIYLYYENGFVFTKQEDNTPVYHKKNTE